MFFFILFHPLQVICIHYKRLVVDEVVVDEDGKFTLERFKAGNCVTRVNFNLLGMILFFLTTL